MNFGDVFIPANLKVPKARVLPEFSRLAHGLRSGNITILDSKTFYIPNLHYDGAGPDAYFWVGNGSEPTTFGIKVPNERKRCVTRSINYTINEKWRKNFSFLQFGTIEGVSRWGHRNRFAGELDGARHWLVVGMVRAIQAQLRARTDTQGPRCSARSWTDQNYGNWKPDVQSRTKFHFLVFMHLLTLSLPRTRYLVPLY